MGAKLSAAQKGVYFQVVGVLVGGSCNVNKRAAKSLVKWLFLHFPALVANVHFWDLVGNKLTNFGKSGSNLLAKLTFWSLQIRTVLKSNQKMEDEPLLGSLPSCSPAPSPPPSPVAPATGILKGATRHLVRGCY